MAEEAKPWNDPTRSPLVVRRKTEKGKLPSPHMHHARYVPASDDSPEKWVIVVGPNIVSIDPEEWELA